MRCGRAILQNRSINKVMTMDKITVVWICSFSNPEIRNILETKSPSLLEKLAYKVVGKTLNEYRDTAIWNVNAIEEFEKFQEVDLHIVSAVRGLKRKEQNFDLRGVHYHFFRDENSSLLRKIYRQLFTKNSALFAENRKNFARIIDRVKPSIVHVIGAENPYYSLAALDVPEGIVTIVQLQALLARLVDVTKNPEEKKSFYYKGELEKQIFRKVDYIGTTVKDFVDYIRAEVKADARFMALSLAMGQKIDRTVYEKQYDFVYWSASILKAGDFAIEAFVLAFKQNPTITLDVIGDYPEEYKAQLIEKLKTVGAENAVTFEGMLPSHDDVLNQIKKSRIALLPLKMDFVPNTLHEAMANGLPVITTRTEGTPKLNVNRHTVEITEQGDFQGMANNMLEVLEDEMLFNELRENGFVTELEYDSNEARMKKWLEAYKDITTISYSKKQA